MLYSNATFSNLYKMHNHFTQYVPTYQACRQASEQIASHLSTEDNFFWIFCGPVFPAGTSSYESAYIHKSIYTYIYTYHNCNDDDDDDINKVIP